MATLDQIQAAMTGFPRALTWPNFRDVQTSPEPPSTAHTYATWSLSGWTAHLAHGVYRVHGARMTVALGHNGTWATQAARSSTDLLQHEQGHFDITGLIARDLISKVLDLSIDQPVVSAMRGSGHTAHSHQRYAAGFFQTEIDQFIQDANSIMNRLQTSPVTHSDGLYDVQTNHSQNATGQQAWNERLQRIKVTNQGFELSLRIEGLI
jgi:hypothetical protein